MPSCGTCPVHPCCEAAPHSPPTTPFCPAPASTRLAAACLRPGRQARAPGPGAQRELVCLPNPAGPQGRISTAVLGLGRASHT